MIRVRIDTILTTKTDRHPTGCRSKRKGFRSGRNAFAQLAEPPNTCAAPAWWPERCAQNPIPSRTRPLNTPAPMVLCLKTRESRSPPGLPSTRVASHIPVLTGSPAGHRPAAIANTGAGWSSPVARQAHNLKVAGSNPAPATNTTTHTIRTGPAKHSPHGQKPRGLFDVRNCAAVPIPAREGRGRSPVTVAPGDLDRAATRLGCSFRLAIPPNGLPFCRSGSCFPVLSCVRTPGSTVLMTTIQKTRRAPVGRRRGVW